MSQLCCLLKTSLHLNSACTKFLFSCSERRQTATRKIKFPIDVGSLWCCRINPSAVCAQRASASLGNAAPAFEIILFERNSAERSVSVCAELKCQSKGAFLWWRSRPLNARCETSRGTISNARSSFCIIPRRAESLFEYTRSGAAAAAWLRASERARALSLYTGVPYYFMW